MKFWNKWFVYRDEGECDELIREEYRRLPLKKLREIETSSLTARGLRIYREEIARRGLAAGDSPLDNRLEPAIAR